MNLFVDSSAWIALDLEDDINHRAACACWQRVLPDVRHILLSTWVFSETVTRLSRELGAVKAFVWGRRLLEHPKVAWVHGDEGLGSRALLCMRQRNDARFSFTDATSWIIAREHAVDAVFAFDRHLRIPGIRLLPEDGGWQVRERPGRYRAGPRRRRTRRISSITATHS